MTGMTVNIKGVAKEAIGAVKQGGGKAIGSPSLEAEGAVQKLKGEAQQIVGETKETLKKFVDKAI